MGAIDSLLFAKNIVLTPRRNPEARQNELPKINSELPKESKYVTTIPRYAIDTPKSFKRVKLSSLIKKWPKVITQIG
jgi:hypothetical protein